MEAKMDKRIKTISKIGRVFTTIVAVFMILAAAATAVGIGVVASLPDDALNIELNGTADVTAKGELLESIADAIVDASKGGEGKIYVGDSNAAVGVAVGDVENSVPKDVTVEKTENGLKIGASGTELNVNKKGVMIALVATLVNTVCTVIILFMIRKLLKSIENCETPFCDEVIRNMKNFGFSLIPFAVLRGVSENAWHYLLSPGFDVHIGVDLTVVCGILVVFMLAMIFSYGAALQKESDETL